LSVLGRAWKEVVLADFKLFSRNLPGETVKINKTLVEITRSPEK